MNHTIPVPKTLLLFIWKGSPPGPMAGQPTNPAINGQRCEGVYHATDLGGGDDLILLRDAEDEGRTQRELFEMFVNDDHGLSQTLRIAAKWQQLVDGGTVSTTGHGSSTDISGVRATTFIIQPSPTGAMGG